jgi:hypothetical protein
MPKHLAPVALSVLLVACSTTPELEVDRSLAALRLSDRLAPIAIDGGQTKPIKVYVISLVDQSGRELFRYQANGFYAISAKPHGIALKPGQYALKTLCRVTDETPLFTPGSFARLAFSNEQGEFVAYQNETIALRAGDDVRLGAQLGPRVRDEYLCFVTFHNVRFNPALTAPMRTSPGRERLEQQR